MIRRFTSPSIALRLVGVMVATVIGLVTLTAMQTLQIRDRVMAAHEDSTKDVVETALGVVAYFGAQEDAGTLTRAQAQKAAKAALEQLRYSGSEYFWINDLTPTMIMHPIKPELNGQNLTENKDPDGKHLFVEMVDVVERQGAGFVHYQWPKPGKDSAQPKVSYVAGYQPWGWVVGSGVYVDDVNAVTWSDAKDMIGFAIAILAAMVGAIVLITRSIVRPIDAAATALAGADPNVRLPEGEGRTELEKLAAALNRTMERASAVVASVTEAAHDLDEAASKLVAGSDHMARTAEGTTAQTSAVTEAAREVSAGIDAVAAGTHQMGSSIAEIAHNAQEAARIAGEAVAAAEATNATVRHLGESSAEIGTVVKTITTIAQQTNLLALNATIEAARAGDSGKGFAVVAGEVKELAQETARATDDISNRVEGIQSAVSQAASEIARISQIIAKINDYQVTIAGAVEEQTATTNEMATTVMLSAESGRGIATTLDEVVLAARDTGSEIDSVRQAAQDLATTSNALKQAVSAFTG